MLLLKMLGQVLIGTKRNIGMKKSRIVYYVTLCHALHASGTLAMLFKAVLSIYQNILQ